MKIRSESVLKRGTVRGTVVMYQEECDTFEVLCYHGLVLTGVKRSKDETEANRHFDSFLKELNDDDKG